MTSRTNKRLFVIFVIALIIGGYLYLSRPGVEKKSLKSEVKGEETTHAAATAAPSPVVTQIPSPTPKPKNIDSQVIPALNDLSNVASSVFGLEMSAPTKIVNDGAQADTGYKITSGVIDTEINYDEFNGILSKYNLSYKANLDGANNSSKHFESINMACSISIGSSLEIVCW